MPINTSRPQLVNIVIWLAFSFSFINPNGSLYVSAILVSSPYLNLTQNLILNSPYFAFGITNFDLRGQLIRASPDHTGCSPLDPAVTQGNIVWIEPHDCSIETKIRECFKAGCIAGVSHSAYRIPGNEMWTNWDGSERGVKSLPTIDSKDNDIPLQVPFVHIGRDESNQIRDLLTRHEEMISSLNSKLKNAFLPIPLAPPNNSIIYTHLQSSDSMNLWQEAFHSIYFTIFFQCVLGIAHICVLLLALYKFHRYWKMRMIRSHFSHIPLVCLALEALANLERAVYCLLDPLGANQVLPRNYRLALQSLSIPWTYTSSLLLVFFWHEALAKHSQPLPFLQKLKIPFLISAGLLQAIDLSLISLDGFYVTDRLAVPVVEIVYSIVSFCVASLLFIVSYRVIMRFKLEETKKIQRHFNTNLKLTTNLAPPLITNNNTNNDIPRRNPRLDKLKHLNHHAAQPLIHYQNIRNSHVYQSVKNNRNKANAVDLSYVDHHVNSVKASIKEVDNQFVEMATVDIRTGGINKSNDALVLNNQKLRSYYNRIELDQDSLSNANFFKDDKIVDRENIPESALQLNPVNEQTEQVYVQLDHEIPQSEPEAEAEGVEIDQHTNVGLGYKRVDEFSNQTNLNDNNEVHNQASINLNDQLSNDGLDRINLSCSGFHQYHYNHSHNPAHSNNLISIGEMKPKYLSSIHRSPNSTMNRTKAPLNDKHEMLLSSLEEQEHDIEQENNHTLNPCTSSSNLLLLSSDRMKHYNHFPYCQKCGIVEELHDDEELTAHTLRPTNNICAFQHQEAEDIQNNHKPLENQNKYQPSKFAGDNNNNHNNNPLGLALGNHLINDNEYVDHHQEATVKNLTVNDNNNNYVNGNGLMDLDECRIRIEMARVKLETRKKIVRMCQYLALSGLGMILFIICTAGSPWSQTQLDTPFLSIATNWLLIASLWLIGASQVCAF